MTPEAAIAECRVSSDGLHVWTRRRDGRQCAFCGVMHHGSSELTVGDVARIQAAECGSLRSLDSTPPMAARDYLNEAGRMKKRYTLMIPEREHIDQLVDLIREAHNALTQPESRVDLRDWVQSAERVLKA